MTNKNASLLRPPLVTGHLKSSVQIQLETKLITAATRFVSKRPVFHPELDWETKGK